MLTLLFASCLNMPLFDMTGPPCANEDIECQCSECFTFDFTDPDNDLDYIQIRRVDQDGTTHYMQLHVVRINFNTPPGHSRVYYPPKFYCPAQRDEYTPLEGRQYKYNWRTCDLSGNCSDWSEQHLYRAAPYMEGVFNGMATNEP